MIDPLVSAAGKETVVSVVVDASVVVEEEEDVLEEVGVPVCPSASKS